MSKTKRRPANHGRHADPAGIRRQNDDSARHEGGAAKPVAMPVRRRRNVAAAGETTRLGPPAGPHPAGPHPTGPHPFGPHPSGSPQAGPHPSGSPQAGPPQAGSPQAGPPQAGAQPAEHEPWTSAGDYLRAAATEEAPARFGTSSVPVDDYAERVWANAFGLAVRRRFEPDSPLAEITRTVTAAVHAHEAAALPVIDVEMLVRAELGEQVPVDELEPAVRISTHLLVFASLVDELALGDGELDELVTRAEQLALG